MTYDSIPFLVILEVADGLVDSPVAKPIRLVSLAGFRCRLLDVAGMGGGRDGLDDTREIERFEALSVEGVCEEGMR